MGLSKLTGGRVAAGLAVLGAVGLVGGYGVALRSRPKPVSLDLSSPGPSPAPESAKRLYVHVGGAVASPGLYGLRDGARVDDAVRAAGGVLEDADLDSLNLAAKVRDGDKVLVPRRGDGGTAGGGSPGAEQKINLNTATVAELDTLPGIGPALAQRIVSYREQSGGFRTVDELQKVPGIGPAKFGQVRDLVTV